MPKGTCQAEVISISEKIKPVALAIIKLRLSEGISQSVGRSGDWPASQSVSQSVENSDFIAIYWIVLKELLGMVILTRHQKIIVELVFG